jgi:hypothetical protein
MQSVVQRPTTARYRRRRRAIVTRRSDRVITSMTKRKKIVARSFPPKLELPFWPSENAKKIKQRSQHNYYK